MRNLLFGFTPDPDDAFAFYGLFHGKVPAEGWRPFFFTAPIDVLNRMAMRGELDVAAVSSGFYPFLARRYDILRSGASVGRGYGPLLAARSPRTLASLAGKVVAIPGETTTGAALLRLFVSDVTTRVLPFDEIREAVARGEVDAGVLIHEELLNYPERSLARILCLGEEWTRRTGLPLPVGLNVVWGDLDPELKSSVARGVRESILYALSHRQEATLWARSFGRGPSSTVAEKFIRMFANDDTVGIDGSVEAGLEELFSRLHGVRLAPRVPAISFVEPERPPARIPAAPDVRKPVLR